MSHGCWILPLLSFALALPSGAADLSRATVVLPPNPSGPERKAAELLVDAVRERTRLHWPVGEAAPADGRPAIVLRRAVKAPSLLAEGYEIHTARGAAVEIVGNDERGILFGVGRLLRALEMRRDSVVLPGELNLRAAPKYALRGHQLGYRPKTNSYDAWDVPQWERYIRDLAVFGTNAIELIPPRSDDDGDSPHFPLPPMQMMVEMSRLAKEYGLQCWIWYPAMDADYSNDATVQAAVAEWGEVIRQLPRVDAVFVPGGDPGHTQPRYLLNLLEKQTANLKKYHPQATMWVSPQGFNAEWMEEFLTLLAKEPGWLKGIVTGPQVRMSMPELRRRVPARYPIRFYPDITHNINAQFAVVDWDVAFAMTEDRESINPRPLDQAQIFRKLQPLADAGFITYSEGANDDVNKMVWSSLGWDPDADTTEVLRQYSRYFVGPDLADGFAHGLLALERNWRGPLLVNSGVDRTLAQFQQMERQATPQVKRNWRFQQALFRAYFDAYVRERLIVETRREHLAMERLAQAGEKGATTAMASAESALRGDGEPPVAPELRTRIFALAEALFQSLGMQLSAPRYGAIASGRGGHLDYIDRYLTNAAWLTGKFAEIRALPDERARVAAIQGVLHWTDPGPGGFYDDLGDPMNRPHLELGPGFEKDPAFVESARTGFGSRGATPWRISWHRHAEALYGNTLRLRYTGLDPAARYKVRFVAAGDPIARATRLVANGSVEIHPMRKKDLAAQPVEFDIPAAASAPGTLTLEWQASPSEPGNGRFIQVSEVWLTRVQSR